MTDEERSNNATPPRTAGAQDEVTPVDCEEKRTPEDVTAVAPVNLDRVLAEAAAMFDDAPEDSCGRPLRLLRSGDPALEPVKQEIIETTTASPFRPSEVGIDKTGEDAQAAPHWERQDFLLPRPGTSSRRPESSSGRLIVYKTAAQKKAEQEARRKRLESENDAAAAGQVARPGTSSRKMSALPPLEERRRTKVSAAQDVEVPEVSTAKGGASWQIDAAGFVPEASSCASPMKKPRAQLKADVFCMEEEEEEEEEGGCSSPVKKPSSLRANVLSLE